MATAARSFSSFCLSIALYSFASTTAFVVMAAGAGAGAIAGGLTSAPPATPLGPGIGLGLVLAAPASGLSSTASSRNFWKYHSDGHRFMAPSALAAPAEARGDGWAQYGSGISST